MQFYVEMLNSIYEMNQPKQRMELREDLKSVGFFNYKENEIYWKLLEKSKVDPPEAEDFAKAVHLYNHVFLRKGVIN